MSEVGAPISDEQHLPHQQVSLNFSQFTRRHPSKYLQAYLDEFVFRFNNRHNEDIFSAVLANC